MNKLIVKQKQFKLNSILYTNHSGYVIVRRNESSLCKNCVMHISGECYKIACNHRERKDKLNIRFSKVY